MYKLSYIFLLCMISSLTVSFVFCLKHPWESTDGTFPSFYSGSVLLRNNKCGKYFSYAGHAYDVQGIITDNCPLNYLNPIGGHSVLSPTDGNELPGAGDYQVWSINNETKTMNLIALDDYGVRHTVNYINVPGSSFTVNLINPETEQLLVYSDEFDQIVDVIPLSINREMPEALWTLIPFPSTDHFNGTFYIESHVCPGGGCLALTIPNHPLEFPAGSLKRISNPTSLAMNFSLRNNITSSTTSREIAAQLWKLVQGPDGLFTIRSVLVPDYCLTKQSVSDPGIMLRATNQGLDPSITDKSTSFSLPPLDFLTGYRIGPITLKGSPYSVYLWWSNNNKLLISRTEQDMPNILSYPNSQWNIIPYSSPETRSKESKAATCTMTWKSNCVCSAS